MAYYSGVGGRKTYTLGQQLASGGEGVVYDIAGDSAHVAKIYKPNRFATEQERQTMERKLRAMLSMNIAATVDGLLRLAWPQDILYENGKIAGFVMPRVSTKYKIFDVYRTGPNSMREKEFPNYNWKYSAQFAYNMAWVVNYLHQNNIVIGDLNQNNIAVDTKTGAVILIDCDSFDIRDPKSGEHFPCVVGLEEMLAPELQTVGSLRNGTFTKESDNFSLAIHIFRMLMNNEDPFGGVMTTGASQSSIPGNRAIINGECAYVRDVPGKKLLPRMPKLEVMPPAIQQLFRRTFDYTAVNAKARSKNRATAAEWVNALAVLSAAEPNPNLKKCAVNPNKHVYPVHNSSCPWCSIEAALRTPIPVPQYQKSTGQTGGSTGTSSTSTTHKTYTPPPYTPPKPVRTARRQPALFYIVLALFGLASGFIFSNFVSNAVYDFFDLYISVGTTNAILSIIGLIAGIWIAHAKEDDYIYADNGLPLLLLGFLVLVIPLGVAVVLGVVGAILVAIISLILSILSFIFAIFCLCSICGSS